MKHLSYMRGDIIKKLGIIIGVALLLVTTIVVDADETVDMNYKDSDYLMIGISNASVYMIETNGLLSDIDLITTNMGNETLITINSIDVAIDYTFINNTKYYNLTVFNETMSDNILVNVDYSSIVVPDNPFLVQIANLTTNNTNLTQQVLNLTNNLSILNVSFNTLNTTYNTQYIQLQQLIIDKDTWNTVLIGKNAQIALLTLNNGNLQSNISALNGTISILDAQIINKDNQIYAYTNTVNELSSFYCMGFTDENGDGRVYINIPYFIIGGLVFIGGFLYIKKRQDFGGSSSTLKDVGDRFTSAIPMLNKTKKSKEVEDWNRTKDPMSSIEEEALKKTPEEEAAADDDKK